MFLFPVVTDIWPQQPQFKRQKEVLKVCLALKLEGVVVRFRTLCLSLNEKPVLSGSSQARSAPMECTLTIRTTIKGCRQCSADVSSLPNEALNNPSCIEAIMKQPYRRALFMIISFFYLGSFKIHLQRS